MKQNWCDLFAHKCDHVGICSNCHEIDELIKIKKEMKEYEEKIHREQGLYDD